MNLGFRVQSLGFRFYKTLSPETLKPCAPRGRLAGEGLELAALSTRCSATQALTAAVELCG